MTEFENVADSATDKGPLVFLAAGGTGGHLFPAEALASALLKRGFQVHLVADKRAIEFCSHVPGTYVHVVKAMSAAGGILQNIRAKIELAKGVHQAYRLIRRHKPVAVVGFGGYPSMPGAVGAILTKTPLVLHDQNAILGRANRQVARFSSVIATSFEEVIGVPYGHRVVYTGNMVRPAIVAARDIPYMPPTPDGPLHILSTGGSQGARVFSEMLPAAFGLLDENLRKRLRIVQQARSETIDSVRESYRVLGLSEQVDLQPFFSDMPQRIANCHLFIGRSGGSTVAELTAIGRPGIYVPLPIAIMDEQTWNVRHLEEMGGAWVVQQRDLTPQSLAALLKRILNDPESLNAAAQAAHAQGQIHAAEKLADIVMDVMKK